MSQENPVNQGVPTPEEVRKRQERGQAARRPTKEDLDNLYADLDARFEARGLYADLDARFEARGAAR